MMGRVQVCIKVFFSFLFFGLYLSSVYSLNLNTGSFVCNGFIPEKYTCDGLNYSPSLNWGDVPDGTKSFLIICNDPDAPSGNWTHWTIFNIPNVIRVLDEAFNSFMPMSEGINDFMNIGYDGPCPPRDGGVHRYFFKIYALDTQLSLTSGATELDIINAIDGHVLDEAEIMGKYERRRYD
ncbi:MAG: YbhB/YbcL family Raf kinase inhibitor-like protein [Candidatus Omnitrophota bacterium]